MLEVPLEFEVPVDWESRAADQRRPAPFIKSAVVVNFSANIGAGLEAADRELPFDGQPVAVTPGFLSSNRPEIYPASIRAVAGARRGAARVRT